MSHETQPTRPPQSHEFFDGFVPHTPTTIDFLERARSDEVIEHIRKIQAANSSRNYTSPTLIKLHQVLGMILGDKKPE